MSWNKGQESVIENAMTVEGLVKEVVELRALPRNGEVAEERMGESSAIAHCCMFEGQLCVR